MSSKSNYLIAQCLSFILLFLILCCFGVHSIHHLLFLNEHLLEAVEVSLQILDLHVRGGGVSQGGRHFVPSGYNHNCETLALNPLVPNQKPMG